MKEKNIRKKRLSKCIGDLPQCIDRIHILFNGGNNMNKNKIKNIAITGMGIALFVTLSMCLRVPVFENYYLCLGYIVMAVYLYSFGISQGMIVGVLGTVLYCFLINGLRGLPGWAIGNTFIAIFVGLLFKFGKSLKSQIAKYLSYICGIIAGSFIGIFIVKSLVESFIYTQPIAIRMANNIYAFIADVVVLIISIPICEKLNKYLNKYN